MNYVCVKQHDITDCCAACLATICKQNGYKIGITQIREVAGTDKQGTNAYGVIKVAEQLAFSAKRVKGDMALTNEELQDILDNLTPEEQKQLYNQIGKSISNTKPTIPTQSNKHPVSKENSKVYCCIKCGSVNMFTCLHQEVVVLR